MSDFECASRNASRRVWPNVIVGGCYFHFCQAIRKKAIERRVLDTPAGEFAVKLYMRLALLEMRHYNDALWEIRRFLRNNHLKRIFRDFHK